ncbi:hypothetical protein CLCR_10922 [Cladophialophora carrionii]|uniref:Uncharacterized protein n=1 Tax=Cladophialophora carrionii TaxID=86049 RepID=A0A1C1CZM2_9EURO|nr:hypothetical protein CLCR_10922 [Cladophialophora carrionii]
MTIIVSGGFMSPFVPCARASCGPATDGPADAGQMCTGWIDAQRQLTRRGSSGGTDSFLSDLLGGIDKASSSSPRAVQTGFSNSHLDGSATSPYSQRIASRHSLVDQWIPSGGTLSTNDLRGRRRNSGACSNPDCTSVLVMSRPKSDATTPTEKKVREIVSILSDT